MRYFSGLGLIGPVFMSGVALDSLYQRISRQQRIPFFILVIIFLYIFAPTLSINKFEKKINLNFFDTSLISTLSNLKMAKHITGYSIYYPKFQDKIDEVILEYTDPNDIIWSDLKYSAGLLSVLSERATSSAMMAEVRPYAEFDPLNVAKLIIWFKQVNGTADQGLFEAIRKYDLRKIGETEICFIYLNPHTKAKKIVPKVIIPNPVLFCILLICLGLISYDILKRKNI